MAGRILVDNVDVDTISETFVSFGGSFYVTIRATEFGGARVELQVASDNDELERWATLPNGTFEAATTKKLDYLCVGSKLRVVVSNTTIASDNIFVDINQ